MLIERVDPAADAGRLAICYQILAECARFDHPGMPVESREQFVRRAQGYGDPVQVWLAADDAGPSGCYLLTLPIRANTQMAWCDLAVPPGRRRSRAGTALLKHCAGQARQAGRRRMAGEAADDRPGAAFAAAMGATSGIAVVYRQLTVDAVLAARLPALRAAAKPHAAGYRLVRWLGVTPDEHLGDSARLSAALADRPTDSGVLAEIWDADRIRYVEQATIDRGGRLYSVARGTSPVAGSSP